MSKPWESVCAKKAGDIGPGVWETDGGVYVQIDRVYGDCVDICFEPTATAWVMKPNDLRQFAEFCNELADQLESPQ